MERKITYPDVDSIKYINKIVNLMSIRKADQYQLLMSDKFIDNIIKDVKKCKGDVYEKGALLLKNLIKAHGFASGNKRTAFITLTYFLTKNRGKVRFKNFDEVEKILRNIQLYDAAEISNWLRKGEINETKFKKENEAKFKK